MSVIRKDLITAAVAAAALAGCSATPEPAKKAHGLTILPLSGEWARPTNAGLNWIATSEQNGIALVDPEGRILDSWDTNAEFLDTRSVRLSGAPLEVFASYNPEAGVPLLFTVSPQGTAIENRASVPSLGFPVEGLCFFHDTDNNDLYLFVLSE